MIGVVQPLEITAEIVPERLQRQGEVGGELPGKVQDAAPAAVDPVDRDPESLQLLVVGDDMDAAPGPSHADRGRVLAEDQGPAPPLAEVIDQPALEPLHLLEVHQAEHVDFQRRTGGGRSHRESFPQPRDSRTVPESPLHRRRR